MTGREIFVADKEFIICAIADEDRNDYVELHRQLNGDNSLYLNPLSKDMMWEQTLNGTDKIFSLFTAEGEYCGSIELQQPDSNTPEIGIDLLENKRNRGIAPRALLLFARRAYKPGRIDYFLIRVSSNNQHSIHVFEKMGVIKIGEEETAFTRFLETFREITKKPGQDLEKFRELFGENDNEVVYCYRLDSDIFL